MTLESVKKKTPKKQPWNKCYFETKTGRVEEGEDRAQLIKRDEEQLWGGSRAVSVPRGPLSCLTLIGPVEP